MLKFWYRILVPDFPSWSQQIQIDLPHVLRTPQIKCLFPAWFDVCYTIEIARACLWPVPYVAFGHMRQRTRYKHNIIQDQKHYTIQDQKHYTIQDHKHYTIQDHTHYIIQDHNIIPYRIINFLLCGIVRKVVGLFLFFWIIFLIRFHTKLYQQTVGIPMNTNCAPSRPRASCLLLIYYEKNFLLPLSPENQDNFIDAFNSVSQYLIALLSIDNDFF